MALPCELSTAMETRITLARTRAKLLRFQAKLCEADDVAAANKLREDADQIDSDVLSWALVAECLRAAIGLRAEVEGLLTGRPVKPERPPLRVVNTVSGGDL